MAVLLDDGVQFGERVVERVAVETGQHDGGHGAFVLWRQRQVGAGHGNGSWHAPLPGDFTA
ncbi:hypothetical protein Shyhy01_76120 [Streptomyces hygroscopicus subsp. hygroscopicus]|nr:hypothetical protein Shyhy01_76120 [Streptomyces hygroscopicus subsp. hygroscopicus]